MALQPNCTYVCAARVMIPSLLVRLSRPTTGLRVLQPRVV